jgi:hypothetical protein
MNYLLVVLMVTGSLLLGPVIGTDEYPWGERPGGGGAGQSAFESEYGGGGNDTAKGKPAE